MLLLTTTPTQQSISPSNMPSATPLPDKPLDVSLQPTPATEEAAKTLVEVHNAANVDDDFLQLMYGPLDEEADSFASDILGIMRGDPTVRFTQAVVSSKEPGKEAEETVVGWAWWNIYPTKADYLAAAKGDKERAKKPPNTSINPAAYLEWKKGVVEKREKWLENTDKGVDGVGEGGVGSMYTLFLFPLVFLPLYSWGIRYTVKIRIMLTMQSAPSPHGPPRLPAPRHRHPTRQTRSRGSKCAQPARLAGGLGRRGGRVYEVRVPQRA